MSQLTEARDWARRMAGDDEPLFPPSATESATGATQGLHAGSYANGTLEGAQSDAQRTGEDA